MAVFATSIIVAVNAPSTGATVTGQAPNGLLPIHPTGIYPILTYGTSPGGTLGGQGASISIG